jgi:hypothetical protein
MNDSDKQTTASVREITPGAELLNLNTPLTLPPGVVGKRVTESYNPNDAYICSNGHLAYNLTSEALADCVRRSVTPSPVVYEGARCHECQETFRKIETDAQTLQFRVANYMKMASRLKYQEKGFLEMNSDYNLIVLFMRDAYAWEIQQGESQHGGALSRAVVYYMRKERRRPSVVAGKMWRAVLRMLGV